MSDLRPPRVRILGSTAGLQGTLVCDGPHSQGREQGAGGLAEWIWVNWVSLDVSKQKRACPSHTDRMDHIKLTRYEGDFLKCGSIDSERKGTQLKARICFLSSLPVTSFGQNTLSRPLAPSWHPETEATSEQQNSAFRAPG